jgi:hypothetical protein
MSPVVVPENRPKPIRFRFAPVKALAAILWMLDRSGRTLDLHTILKTCYFADKAHLNQHGRPIFGASYRAMRFGPVPQEIYEMTKCEPIWLPELDGDSYPWALEGHWLRRTSNEHADFSSLSESDMEAIKLGFDLSQGTTFNERTAATHGPDWQAANMGVMRYEDMIEDSEFKEDTVAYLREAGRFIRL